MSQNTATTSAPKPSRVKLNFYNTNDMSDDPEEDFASFLDNFRKQRKPSPAVDEEEDMPNPAPAVPKAAPAVPKPTPAPPAILKAAPAAPKPAPAAPKPAPAASAAVPPTPPRPAKMAKQTVPPAPAKLAKPSARPMAAVPTTIDLTADTDDEDDEYMSSSDSGESDDDALFDDSNEEEEDVPRKATTTTTTPPPRQGRKPTRLEEILGSMTQEQLHQVVSQKFIYADSTMRKHKYAHEIYARFAEALGLDGEFIDIETACKLVPLLMKDGVYTVDTVVHVILASLKRIFREQQDRDFTSAERRALSQAVQQGKSPANNPRVGTGKDALLLSDVGVITGAIPDGDRSKAHDAAMMLIAVQTGLRAISMANLELRDIARVASNGETLQVTLNVRVTKGSKQWNHPITLEGYPGKPCDVDAVYWLAQHLKTHFKLDITKFGTGLWTTIDKNQRLFQANEMAMCARLKTRALHAGYPIKLFGFHSLRSGFMGTAALLAWGNADGMKACLEITQFIAGWKPNSKVQQRYVKKSVERALNASRLVAGAQLGLPSNVVDKEIVNQPERFHGFQLAPVPYRDNTNMQSFADKLQELIKKLELSEAENKRRYNSLVQIGFRLFTESRADLNKQVLVKKRKEGIDARNAKVRVAREFITRSLNEDFSQLDELVQEVYDCLEDNGDLDRPMAKFKARERVSNTPEVLAKRPKVGKARQRRAWTDEEDAVLRAAVEEFDEDQEAWRAASEELDEMGSDRTAKDCYDRFRNLKKKKSE